MLADPEFDKAIAPSKPSNLADKGDNLEFADLGKYDERIQAIYDESVKAAAALVGCRPVPYVEARDAQRRNLGLPVVREAPQAGIFSAKLTTPTGAGTILYMPRVPYRIKLAAAKLRGEDWERCQAGESVAMNGIYIYKILYPNGAETRPGTLTVNRSGRYPLQ